MIPRFHQPIRRSSKGLTSVLEVGFLLAWKRWEIHYSRMLMGVTPQFLSPDDTSKKGF
jgi:hypothetical protein